MRRRIRRRNRSGYEEPAPEKEATAAETVEAEEETVEVEEETNGLTYPKRHFMSVAREVCRQAMFKSAHDKRIIIAKDREFPCFWFTDGHFLTRITEEDLLSLITSKKYCQLAIPAIPTEPGEIITLIQGKVIKKEVDLWRLLDPEKQAKDLVPIYPAPYVLLNTSGATPRLINKGKFLTMFSLTPPDELLTVSISNAFCFINYDFLQAFSAKFWELKFYTPNTGSGPSYPHISHPGLGGIYATISPDEPPIGVVMPMRTGPDEDSYKQFIPSLDPQK